MGFLPQIALRQRNACFWYDALKAQVSQGYMPQWYGTCSQQREKPMTVRTEQQDHVTTVIIDRVDARNAVDHSTADLLT
jgi:hypothetical protein